MSDNSPIHLEPGYYQIIDAKLDQPGLELEALTRLGEHGQVTLRPIGTSVQPDQLWLVRPVNDKNVIITRDLFRPATPLTYEGAPAPPKSGALVVAHLEPGQITEWQIGIAVGLRQSLRVADSDLGIAIGHSLPVEPPRPTPLVLSEENQLAFKFKFIRPIANE